MKVILTIKENLYLEDKKGKQKLVKRGIKIRREIDTNDIKEHHEVYNRVGKVFKNRCLVKLGEDTTLIVEHSFDYISKLKNPIRVKGFIVYV